MAMMVAAAMTLMAVELWRGGGGDDETCGGDGDNSSVRDSHCGGYGCGGWCVINFFFPFSFSFSEFNSLSLILVKIKLINF